MQIGKDDAVRHSSVWTSDEIRRFDCVSVFSTSCRLTRLIVLFKRCMKDGKLVESGSHSELMDIGGEYAKLYGIQAKAFSSES